VPLQISPPAGEVIPKIREAVEAAIPGAKVEVIGEAGHFSVRVTSEAFAGKTVVAKQRMVYSAIAPLMKGDHAPVHAIDRLETLEP
jgi:acid stress-induced BolA-like protein IbaG/YrbA